MTLALFSANKGVLRVISSLGVGSNPTLNFNPTNIKI